MAMTDQTTTTVGSRTGPTGPARQGQVPSPRDLAARAPARDAAAREAAARPAAPAASSRGPGDEQQAGQPVLMTGAQALVAALERLGVDVVFGIPGGAILPAYDPLFDSRSVRHILVRHEQGAGHAAAGYAQVTWRPGVCMATSGPGATNLVTPLADAYMDSVPVVAITGQVPSSLIGTDGFQEVDIAGITLPVTKHNFLITEAGDIARTVAEAFHLASTGRPGPVLVDIAKDALQAKTQFHWPIPFELPGYRPVTRPHSRQVREAARMMMAAQRPVLYVGGGVIKAGASEELLTLAELTGMPVVTTLMARGAFPSSHQQNLGMPGMHGKVAAVGALQKADLLIALGARFDDRVTGRLDSFAPEAAVLHAWRATYPLGYDEPDDGSLSPQYVIERIGKLAGPDAYYVAGVGQHQMWAAQFIEHERPRHWLNSGGLGTMGYAVPAAMGAKVAAPDAAVWAIDGDGCFQMTNQELATCTVEGIPIKVAIINNGNLGMVRQWQTLFYNERYSHTDLDKAEQGSSAGTRIPDFVKLAEAYGCAGLRCETAAEVDAVIKQAMGIQDRPVVIDFVVHRDAMVWPMVAAGTSNDDIKVARDMAPDWDVTE